MCNFFSNIFLLSVHTAQTGVPKGAAGPLSQQPPKSKNQVYYIVEYIFNFYAFLGPIEPQLDMHIKKPKPAAVVNSSSHRFCQQNVSTNQPLPAKQLQTVTSLSKSALTEVRVIMSCHNVLFTMMTNEKTLTETLSLYYLILEKIQKVSSFPELKAFVYSMFTKTTAKSFYEFLCCLFYIGFTADETENSRISSHAKIANLMFKNETSKASQSDKLYRRIVACWQANVKVFFQKVRSNMSEKQAYFSEHALITFASNMLQNCNGNQGNQFDDVLKNMGVDRESIVKIGCALLVDYYKTSNISSFTQIPRDNFTVDPARTSDYMQ